jgi:hypothetical protein
MPVVGEAADVVVPVVQVVADVVAAVARHRPRAHNVAPQQRMFLLFRLRTRQEERLTPAPHVVVAEPLAPLQAVAAVVPVAEAPLPELRPVVRPQEVPEVRQLPQVRQ